MMKLTLVSAMAGYAAAFAPAPMQSSSSTALRSSVGDNLNGWKPNQDLPCYGLPGAPYSFMDPLGFTKNKSISEVKRIREAEVMHCRVGMMAFMGYFIGESTPTIFYGTDVHHTIANNQLAELPIGLLLPLFLGINFAEAYRATKGWNEPGSKSLFSIRESHYPGDLGFDPLNLKPVDNAQAFAEMQDGELNNGRMAMLAVAVMCVQEQVTGHGVLENLGF
mmetsp:Transcript_29959/g.60207  ORF Transcript_29959/g.60207 Transcript_29959/m.60207 type:complete len:221 (-) Transcript_29959:26-688(-)